MSTWAPDTNEQLKALSRLQFNKNINVKPVALQENAARVRAYNAIAGYNLSLSADPNSNLTASLYIGSLPIDYFLNANGMIKKVVCGVLSKQQLLDEVSML